MPKETKQLTLDQINPELLNVNILIALLKACQDLEHIFAIRAKELAYDDTELNIALQNLNQIITFKEKLVNLIERTQAIKNLEQSKLKPINEDTKIALEILQYIHDTYQIKPKDLLLFILQNLDLATIKHEIHLHPGYQNYPVPGPGPGTNLLATPTQFPERSTLFKGEKSL